MTTGNKPDAAEVTGITLTPGLEGVSAEAAGLPDVATLTRLANAFFTAPPGAVDILGAEQGPVPSAAAGSPGVSAGGGRPLQRPSPHCSWLPQRPED